MVFEGDVSSFMVATLFLIISEAEGIVFSGVAAIGAGLSFGFGFGLTALTAAVFFKASAAMRSCDERRRRQG